MYSEVLVKSKANLKNYDKNDELLIFDWNHIILNCFIVP